MKTIITIGRQFGSGGKEIGIRVAKELGISNATLYRKLKQYRIQQNTLFE